MAEENFRGRGAEDYLIRFRAGEIEAGGCVAVFDRDGRSRGFYEVRDNGSLAGALGVSSASTVMISSDRWKYIPPVEQKKAGKRS